MSAAAAMWARECHYEVLHHQQRLEDLEALAATRNLDWLEREMLRQTKQFLANPIGGSGGRFDVNNTARVAELDAWEASHKLELAA